MWVDATTAASKELRRLSIRHVAFDRGSKCTSTSIIINERVAGGVHHWFRIRRRIRRVGVARWPFKATILAPVLNFTAIAPMKEAILLRMRGWPTRFFIVEKTLACGSQHTPKESGQRQLIFARDRPSFLIKGFHMG